MDTNQPSATGGNAPAPSAAPAVRFTPQTLERYSFLWTEARLVIAALSLLAGGVPIAALLLPSLLTFSLLTWAWIISGLASGYLTYRWYQQGQTVFGGKDSKDLAAFFVSVISGINLGLTSFIGKNLGMSIVPNRLVYAAAGVLYLIAAYRLYTRWKARGEKLF